MPRRRPRFHLVQSHPPPPKLALTAATPAAAAVAAGADDELPDSLAASPSRLPATLIRVSLPRDSLLGTCEGADLYSL